VAPTRRDERWSVDFMHDQLQDGRRLRVLTVVDQYTREALATEARGSFSAAGRHMSCEASSAS
jgi:putative transposase